jgi:hypothetical protein
MDEIYNERKQLIENYVNKVYALDEFQRLKPQFDEKTKEELDAYKLKNIGKHDIFLESDDEEDLDLLKNEIRKKKFENQNKNDVSSSNIDDMLANTNEDKQGFNEFELSLKRKIQEAIKKKRYFNRGYGFVTFANSVTHF